MALDCLNCNRCGASLAVPPTVDFVGCALCGARLAIRRRGNAVYTEPVQGSEAAEPHGEDGGDALADFRQRNELASLDREWGLVRSYHALRQPIIGVGGGLVVLGLGLAATVLGLSSGSGLFVFMGVLITLAGGRALAHALVKARAYRDAFQDYIRRRQDLLWEKCGNLLSKPAEESRVDDRFRVAD
jgi:hypothetical protein